MTKLFEDDAYLKEFKAKIIGIVKEENRIELDKTAFYAKSGGQPGDTGAVESGNIKIQVLDPQIIYKSFKYTVVKGRKSLKGC